MLDAARHGAGEVTVFVVRHAPPSVSGLCFGRSEVEVEPAVTTAPKVLNRFAERGFSMPRHIVSSPSARCSELARELKVRTNAILDTDARLYELCFGDWENRAWSDIDRTEGSALARWMADWEHVAPPRGESVQELEERVRSWWREVALGPPLLAVTHAGVIRALWVITSQSRWPEAMQRSVPHLEPFTFAR